MYFRPDLIAYEELIPNEHIDNLNNAFNVADEKLGIHKILDAEGEYTQLVKASMFIGLYDRGFPFQSNPKNLDLSHKTSRFVRLF